MGAWLTRSVCAFLCCALGAARASAQHCHAPSEPRGELVHATVRAEAAHFESDSEPGFYEGVSLRSAFELGMLRASAGLPYYRLLELDGVSNGFGDLDAKLELSVLGNDDDGWSLGPALFVSFPTGSAEKRLGMGHVMVGPSVWFTLQGSRAFLAAEVGYEQAIAAEDEEPAESPHSHHHHAESQTHDTALGPIPNPMNMEELWVGATSSYAVLEMLAPYVGGTVAVPTSEEGSVRATLRAGATLPIGALVTEVGFEIDLLGVTRREVLVTSIGFRY